MLAGFYSHQHIVYNLCVVFAHCLSNIFEIFLESIREAYSTKQELIWDIVSNLKKKKKKETFRVLSFWEVDLVRIFLNFSI